MDNWTSHAEHVTSTAKLTGYHMRSCDASCHQLTSEHTTLTSGPIDTNMQGAVPPSIHHASVQYQVYLPMALNNNKGQGGAKMKFKIMQETTENIFLLILLFRSYRPLCNPSVCVCVCVPVEA